MKHEWREKCEDLTIFVSAIAVIVWLSDLFQFLRMFKWMP